MILILTGVIAVTMPRRHGTGISKQ